MQDVCTQVSIQMLHVTGCTNYISSITYNVCKEPRFRMAFLGTDVNWFPWRVLKQTTKKCIVWIDIYTNKIAHISTILDYLKALLTKTKVTSESTMCANCPYIVVMQKRRDFYWKSQSSSQISTLNIVAIYFTSFQKYLRRIYSYERIFKQ